MKSAICVWMMGALLCVSVAGEPIPAKGSVSSVIVYRGQALVSRTFGVQEAGSIELLVEALPQNILPESLYAQSKGQTKILSVRYREKTIAQDNQQEIKELQAKIYDIQRKIETLNMQSQMNQKRMEWFAEKWKFTIDLSKAEKEDLAAKIDFESITKTTEYLDTKTQQIHEEMLRIDNERKDCEKQRQDIDKQLGELAGKQPQKIREALIYLDKPAAGAETIELSYLVQNAGWSAQYNLRATPGQKKASIEYSAVVHQASGEDWTNTTIALSTAEPTAVASPAELIPMEVVLTNAVAPRVLLEMAEKTQVSAVTDSSIAPQPQLVDQSGAFDKIQASRRADIAKGIQAQQSLNTIAIRNQMLEMEADRRMFEEMKQKAAVFVRTEGVSVLYALRGNLTLPSRMEQQLVNIASFECPADYYLTASPLLTDYVYLLADLTNTSDIILLPGVATMFRDGQFVGKGDIKLVTIGQTFTAGFGIDSQIQVAREFADKKTESFLGGKTNEQQYRLAISNYKSEPIKLRLFERIPWTQTDVLEIILKDMSHPLSKDADYLRTEYPKGILRWDLVLDANSSGSNATVVKYGYEMKHDRDMRIVPKN